MANRPPNSPESRSEPEVIPPDRTRLERGRGASGIWVSIEEGGRRRIHIAQPGLFTTILLALFFGVVVAAMLALFLGTFLILVPAIIVIVFALIVAGIARGYFNRIWSRRIKVGHQE
jgi:hypothetical protein